MAEMAMAAMPVTPLLRAWRQHGLQECGRGRRHRLPATQCCEQGDGELGGGGIGVGVAEAGVGQPAVRRTRTMVVSSQRAGAVGFGRIGGDGEGLDVAAGDGWRMGIMR